MVKKRLPPCLTKVRPSTIGLGTLTGVSSTSLNSATAA